MYPEFAEVDFIAYIVSPYIDLYNSWMHNLVAFERRGQARFGYRSIPLLIVITSDCPPVHYITYEDDAQLNCSLSKISNSLQTGNRPTEQTRRCIICVELEIKTERNSK